MSKPEIKLSGFLQDAFTKWRQLLCYMGKPGVAKKAKTEYSRAVRRKWKRLVRVDHEASDPATEDKPCSICGGKAEWLFMPASDTITEDQRWACDRHVPRDCQFCNSGDDGNPLPKPWGPCVRWLYIGEVEQHDPTA